VGPRASLLQTQTYTESVPLKYAKNSPQNIRGYANIFCGICDTRSSIGLLLFRELRSSVFSNTKPATDNVEMALTSHHHITACSFLRRRRRHSDGVIHASQTLSSAARQVCTATYAVKATKLSSAFHNLCRPFRRRDVVPQTPIFRYRF